MTETLHQEPTEPIEESVPIVERATRQSADLGARIPIESDLGKIMLDLLEVEETDWQQLAACRGADPDIFFPERGSSTKTAKSICRACSVRAECLEYAIVSTQRFGIWGGFSERERRKLRRERADEQTKEKS